jgi:hypothetical protein
MWRAAAVSWRRRRRFRKGVVTSGRRIACGVALASARRVASGVALASGRRVASGVALASGRRVTSSVALALTLASVHLAWARNQQWQQNAASGPRTQQHCGEVGQRGERATDREVQDRERTRR